MNAITPTPYNAEGPQPLLRSTPAGAAYPTSALGPLRAGTVKLQSFFADAYVLAADMSALAVVAATLEAMPRDAKGLAFIEITSPEDQQVIDAPVGVTIDWIIQPSPHQPSVQSVEKIKALPDFLGSVQTCIAGESAMIKTLREELVNRRRLPKSDMYISGYWKIGLKEDEHQKAKNKAA
ncbi:siderophore-interacting protein [Pacificibacter sp. AS14]|uniref:siderophore-interacting protein n=1 Tax=Pacificibacter sp. AS14 TaxID=3135785 RepID=UPI00316AFA9E